MWSIFSLKASAENIAMNKVFNFNKKANIKLQLHDEIKDVDIGYSFASHIFKIYF